MDDRPMDDLVSLIWPNRFGLTDRPTDDRPTDDRPMDDRPNRFGLTKSIKGN